METRKAFLAMDSGDAHKYPESMAANFNTTFSLGDRNESASKGWPSTHSITYGGNSLI